MPEKTKEELLLIVNTVLKNGGREALDALPLDADLRSDIGFEDSPVSSFRQILDKIA